MQGMDSTNALNPQFTMQAIPCVYIPLIPVYYNYPNTKLLTTHNCSPQFIQEASTTTSTVNLNNIVDDIISTTRKNVKRPYSKSKVNGLKSADHIPKRKRKNADQIKILTESLDHEWTQKDIDYLIQKTGLNKTQVYKWRWDYTHSSSSK